MPFQSFGVEEYAVYAVAENTPGYSGIYGYVRLYWQGAQRATLWFYRDAVSTIPANSSSGSAPNTSYYARFRQAALRDSVDLLRNEKPVFFQWNEASKGAFLATGQEPVGEQELP